QPSLTALNSIAYTDRISLFLFLLHMVAAVGLVCFLIFKGIQGLIQASESIKTKKKRVLQFYLPQVEAASFFSITLALAWQKVVSEWALFMVHFILWSSFVMSLSAGILLICFQNLPLKALESVLLPLQLAMDCMLVGSQHCLCKINKIMEGEYVMKEMVKFGVPPDIAICRAITNGYCKEMDFN
ncbi:pentatricopeptide repeat-containing protein, partial [Quercus suber]